MYEIAKNNPVLKSESAVANYSFLVDDGITYLIMNEPTGDNAYIRDYTIPAGEFLNGFDVSAWNGQTLIIDEKHIAYGVSEDYDDLTVYSASPATAAALLKVKTGGKLEITQSAPTSGVYFKVVDRVKLTEKAVEVKIIVVDQDTVSSGTTG